MSSPEPRVRLARRLAAIHDLAVVGAFGLSLAKAKEDYDGLNNMAQLVLALPWAVIVPSPGDQLWDAVVLLAPSFLNTWLIYRLVSGRNRKVAK